MQEFLEFVRPLKQHSFVVASVDDVHDTSGWQISRTTRHSTPPDVPIGKPHAVRQVWRWLQDPSTKAWTSSQNVQQTSLFAYLSPLQSVEDVREGLAVQI